MIRFKDTPPGATPPKAKPAKPAVSAPLEELPLADGGDDAKTGDGKAKKGFGRKKPMKRG